jgi:hypothetical protein
MAQPGEDMAKMFPDPEKKFQRHIAQYLERVNKHAVLQQSKITNTGHYFAEDLLLTLRFALPVIHKKYR